MKIKVKLQLLSVLLFLAILSPCAALAFREASGIAYYDNNIYMVGDQSGWKVFSVKAEDKDFPKTFKFNKLYPVHKKDNGVIEVKKIKPENDAHIDNADIEAVGFIPGIGVVALSEQRAGIVSSREVGKNGKLRKGKLLVKYPPKLAERKNSMGLEGLAIRKGREGASRVAVLWEGGYDKGSSGVVKEPRIWVHDIKKNDPPLYLRRDKDGELLAFDAKGNVVDKREIKTTKLIVPIPEGEGAKGAMRYRAPGLVWCKLKGNKWVFLVLLNAKTYKGEGDVRFGDKRLQVFKRDGTVLDEKSFIMLPRKESWEGISWFEEGESVFLTHDSKDSTAEVMITDVKALGCVSP